MVTERRSALQCAECGLINPSATAVCDCGSTTFGDVDPNVTIRKPQKKASVLPPLLLALLTFVGLRAVFVILGLNQSLMGEIVAWTVAVGGATAVASWARRRRGF